MLFVLRLRQIISFLVYIALSKSNVSLPGLKPDEEIDNNASFCFFEFAIQVEKCQIRSALYLLILDLSHNNNTIHLLKLIHVHIMRQGYLISIVGRILNIYLKISTGDDVLIKDLWKKFGLSENGENLDFFKTRQTRKSFLNEKITCKQF